MNRYLVTVWTAVLCGISIWRVTVAGHATPWAFAVLAVLLTAAVFFRDRWRGKYLDLKARTGPPRHGGYTELPSSVRLLRPGAPDDQTRDIPVVRDDDGRHRRH